MRGKCVCFVICLCLLSVLFGVSVFSHFVKWATYTKMCYKCMGNETLAGPSHRSSDTHISFSTEKQCISRALPAHFPRIKNAFPELVWTKCLKHIYIYIYFLHMYMYLHVDIHKQLCAQTSMYTHIYVERCVHSVCIDLCFVRSYEQEGCIQRSHRYVGEHARARARARVCVCVCFNDFASIICLC